VWPAEQAAAPTFASLERIRLMAMTSGAWEPMAGSTA
jgi:hypothetical protein